MFINVRLIPLVLICTFFAVTSCVNTRKAVYFVDQNDATLQSTTVIPESVIQKNDFLGISVSSLNPTASAVFNAPTMPSAAGGSIASPGYLVDASGNIQFPILGNIPAAGLTGNQLRESIVRSLTDKKLLVDPIVSVRYLNFKVTVLGEVARPTVVNVPNEKITLLEALGMAGDLTIFGKRENVMVIREEGTQKIIKRINLNTSELFNSPFYYLKSNDIVYVEPNKAKVASSARSNQILPIVLSALSFAAIVVDRATRGN
jgi:polysaccharide export outer membrane protein